MDIVIHEELQERLNSLVAKGETFTEIKTDADLEALTTIMSECKRIISTIEGLRKSVTSKLDAEKKRIMDQERQLTAPINAMMKRARSLSDAYLAERTRLAEEAKKKALAAAQEAQEAYERNASAMAAFGIAPSQEEPTYQPTLTQAETQVLVPLSNVSARVAWDFEIVNADLVPRQFLTPSAPLIKAHIQQLKKAGASIESVSIPGLRVFAKTSTVIR